MRARWLLLFFRRSPNSFLLPTRPEKCTSESKRRWKWKVWRVARPFCQSRRSVPAIERGKSPRIVANYIGTSWQRIFIQLYISICISTSKVNPASVSAGWEFKTQNYPPSCNTSTPWTNHPLQPYSKLSPLHVDAWQRYRPPKRQRRYKPMMNDSWIMII